MGWCSGLRQERWDVLRLSVQPDARLLHSFLAPPAQSLVWIPEEYSLSKIFSNQTCCGELNKIRHSAFLGTIDWRACSDPRKVFPCLFHFSRPSNDRLATESRDSRSLPKWTTVSLPWIETSSQVFYISSCNRHMPDWKKRWRPHYELYCARDMRELTCPCSLSTTFLQILSILQKPKSFHIPEVCWLHLCFPWVSVWWSGKHLGSGVRGALAWNPRSALCSWAPRLLSVLAHFILYKVVVILISKGTEEYST